MRWFSLFLMLCALCVGMPTALPAMTADQYLVAADKPTFKDGVTLPRLLLTGYAQSDAFWQQWHAGWHGAYQIPLSKLDGTDISAITTSQGYRMARYAQAHNIAVAANVVRALQIESYMWALRSDTWARNATGVSWPGYGTSGTSPPHATRTPGCWSPAMSTSVYTQAGVDEAVSLAVLQGYADIEQVLHDGEQGLDVPSARHPSSTDPQDWFKWSQDASCVTLFGGAPTEATVSARRMALLSAEFAALKAAAPHATTFIYYRACYQPLSGANSETWKAWLGKWSDLRALVTHATPDFYHTSSTSFTDTYDLLTKALCCVGGQIAAGDATFMPYVSGGWGTTARANADAYLGFLKALAMAGARGYVCGDFDPSVNTSASYDACPDWLTYRMITAHAQAYASWIDPWVSGGALLPGPSLHQWNKALPAYEYPTGEGKASRCLIRQRNVQQDYLVLVWNASGVDRYVTVSTPLGTCRLYARACGTTYRLTASGLQLLDENYTNPSVSLSLALTAPAPTVVNAAPTATSSLVYVKKNTTTAIRLTASDANGDPITYTVTRAPLHGSVLNNGGIPVVTYTPATGYAGMDSFTFAASDGKASSNTATITIKVAAY